MEKTITGVRVGLPATQTLQGKFNFISEQKPLIKHATLYNELIVVVKESVANDENYAHRTSKTRR